MAYIPDSPEEIFDEFTRDFKSIYDSQLISINLYGTSAKGEYIAKKSDINFLIVLDKKGIEELDKSFAILPKWRKCNVAVPLFLTKAYINSSLDTFPIEFLDMQNFYKLIYGEDILNGLVIKESHLRHQIERELRGKLIHLREGFLIAGHDRDRLLEMLAASVPSFILVFAALLFLKKEMLPHSKESVFQRTSEIFGLQNCVFRNLVSIKKIEWHGSKVQLHEVTKAYIKQVDKLVEIVDKM